MKIIIDSQGIETKNINILKLIYKLDTSYKLTETNYSFYDETLTASEETYIRLKEKFSDMGFIAKQWSDKTLIHLEIENYSRVNIQKWIEEQVADMSPNMSIKKLKELCSYLILEQERKQDNNSMTQISIELLESMWVMRDEMIEDIDDIWIGIQKPWLYELILLSLYLDEVLERIYFQEDTQRDISIHSEYAVKIKPQFKHNSLIDTKPLLETLQSVQPHTKEITLKRTLKWDILELTHVLLENNVHEKTRMIELLQQYPHSNITASIYNSRVNKYTIVERIRVNDIETYEE